MLRPYASNFERIWYWSHRSICGLVLLFLMLPVLIMIPLSFNGGAFLVYPLQGWSLRWYETFFTSPEWMRALGFGQEALREANLCFVVRSMAIDFRMPARLDDGLSVSVRLAQCRGASLVIAQEVRRGGELLVGAEVRVASVSADAFRPVPIPQAVLARLTPESP